MPTLEFTQSYTSSINIQRLLEKISEWELYGDAVENRKEEFEKELREFLGDQCSDNVCGCCQRILTEILGE